MNIHPDTQNQNTKILGTNRNILKQGLQINYDSYFNVNLDKQNDGGGKKSPFLKKRNILNNIFPINKGGNKEISKKTNINNNSKNKLEKPSTPQNDKSPIAYKRRKDPSQISKSPTLSKGKKEKLKINEINKQNNHFRNNMQFNSKSVRKEDKNKLNGVEKKETNHRNFKYDYVVNTYENEDNTPIKKTNDYKQLLEHNKPRTPVKDFKKEFNNKTRELTRQSTIQIENTKNIKLIEDKLQFIYIEGNNGNKLSIKEKEEFMQISKLIKDLKDSTNENKFLRELNAKYKEQISEAEKNINDLTRENNALIQSNEDYKKKLKEKNKEIIKYINYNFLKSEEIESLNKAIAYKDEIIKTIQLNRKYDYTKEGKCSNEFNDMSNQIIDLNLQNSNLTNIIETLKEDNAKLSNECDEYKKNEEEQKKLYTELCLNRDKDKKMIESLSYESEKNKKENEKNINIIKVLNQSLIKEKNEKNQLYKELKDKDDDLEIKHELNIRLTERLNGKEEDISNLNEEIYNLQSLIAQMQSELEKINDNNSNSNSNNNNNNSNNNNHNSNSYSNFPFENSKNALNAININEENFILLNEKNKITKEIQLTKEEQESLKKNADIKELLISSLEEQNQTYKNKIDQSQEKEKEFQTIKQELSSITFGANGIFSISKEKTKSQQKDTKDNKTPDYKIALQNAFNQAQLGKNWNIIINTNNNLEANYIDNPLHIDNIEKLKDEFTNQKNKNVLFLIKEIFDNLHSEYEKSIEERDKYLNDYNFLITINKNIKEDYNLKKKN